MLQCSKRIELKRNQVGCLLIHGFGGDRGEVIALATHLEGQGYPVACPQLAGHTGKRADLRGVSYNEWIRAAEKSLVELDKECDSVILIGFSMGGLIAFNLALTHKPLCIITINTPIYYWDIKRIVQNVSDDIKTRKFFHTKRYIANSAKFPFSALDNFQRLLRKTKAILKENTSPLYVLQAIDDDTTRQDSAAYILKHVASDNKKVDYLNNSGHLMLRSPAATEAIAKITTYIAQFIEG